MKLEDEKIGFISLVVIAVLIVAFIFYSLMSYSNASDIFYISIRLIFPLAGLILTFYFGLKKLKLLKEKANSETFSRTFSKMQEQFSSLLKEITETQRPITIDEIKYFEQKYNVEIKLKQNIRFQNSIKMSSISFALYIVQEMQTNGKTEKEQQEILIDLSHGYGLNKFFELLLQILKLIERNETVKESQTYIGIIKSSLSDNIFHLLKIYSFAEKEGDKYYEYKKLVEEFKIL